LTQKKTINKYIFIGLNNFGLKLSVLHWINDVLMAIFFLFVTLEIKREFIQGELSNIKQAILPIIAAVGGMLVPALIYIYINFEDLMLFEVGPVFKGSKPGEQLTMIGAIKTGKYSRKNWIEKERNFDVFDIKNDALRTLNEVGIDSSKIVVSNKTKKWYHPGRSGLPGRV